MSDIEEVYELLNGLENHKKYNALEYYAPYDFQKNFHFAKGEGKFKCVPSDPNLDRLAIHRALMCANQIGKSFSGGRETAYHLTGLYPDWWEGHRFSYPVEWICSSTTNETTRDRCQKELLGEPADQNMLGTGGIPKSCIGELTRKAGVPNAWETVMVKHVSGGWSKAYFKPYEQGAKKFMGYKLHGAWCDEEPPQDIWSQILRALLASNGIGYITFTPEEGVTEVVYGFMDDLGPGQALITATWDDAPHMDPETIEQKLQTLPPHEREMRSRGVPLMGSGVVFPIPDEHILIEPFEIPAHWPRIVGIDYGTDHPFAAAWWAFDRESGKAYLYDVYKQTKLLLSEMADIMRKHGDWIPIAYPHDVNKEDPKSGQPLANIFRDDYGLNMLPKIFSNPPSAGQKEGQGGQGVEVGLLAMFQAMEQGSLKVFSTCKDFFSEKGTYHRKDGKIVRKKDDIMSASRYGYQSQRFADVRPTGVVQQSYGSGLSNW